MLDSDQDENKKIIFIIGDSTIECEKTYFLLESNFIESEMNSPIKIDMNLSEDDFKLAKRYLQKGIIDIHNSTYNLFEELNNILQIPQLSQKLFLFKQKQFISNSQEANLLLTLNDLLFGNITDIEEAIERSINIYDKVGLEIFIRALFYGILSFPYNTVYYLSILRQIPDEEATNKFVAFFESKFETITSKYHFKNEIYYLAHCLIMFNLIKKEKLFSRINELFPLVLIHLSGVDPAQIPQSKVKWKFFVDNFSSLSEDNWKLHRDLVEAGTNPNPIAFSIRTDDVESLRSLSMNPYFDPNMVLENCIYERSTIVSKNITLLEYAAFHKSSKCFQFLLKKSSNVENICQEKIFLYLACSGLNYNEELVYNYKNYLNYAIFYHQTNIVLDIFTKTSDFDIYFFVNALELVIEFCDFYTFFHIFSSVVFPIDLLKEIMKMAKKNGNNLLEKFIFDYIDFLYKI